MPSPGNPRSNGCGLCCSESNGCPSGTHSYKVYGRHERFYRLGGEHFRSNQIWRTVIDRRTGNRVGEELIRSNCALVKYLPQGVEIHELTHTDGEVSDDPRHRLNRLENAPPIPAHG